MLQSLSLLFWYIKGHYGSLYTRTREYYILYIPEQENTIYFIYQNKRILYTLYNRTREYYILYIPEQENTIYFIYQNKRILCTLYTRTREYYILYIPEQENTIIEQSETREFHNL